MSSPTYDIYTAPKRDSFHWKPSTITWDEIRGWMAKPAKTKACGNYVLGTFVETTELHKTKDGTVPPPCHEYHRNKMSIRTRGALTLDVDHPEPGFLVDALMLPYRVLIHTTYSSTPEEPRYRMIIPLDRPIAPDEYYTAAASVMQALGDAQFDAGSVEPERYMFKPSESEPGYFSWHEVDGPIAAAEELLLEFNPDLSTLPMPKPHKNKRDPFLLEGTIGAFNRAYEDFGDLIKTYELPYEAVSAERWQLVGASAAAGMGIVAPGLVYSHHANDPAYGQTCSAFDLVRLHLYGHMDDPDSKTPVNRLPSTRAMQEHATTDIRVVTELLGSDFVEEMEDVADDVDGDPDVNWMLGLRLDPKTGGTLDDVRNWDLIVRHDPAFRAVRYNEMTSGLELTTDLPWRKIGTRTDFDDEDRAALALHVERSYHFRPGRQYLNDVLDGLAQTRRVNPVRDYLDKLKWDGVPRVETCLPGAADTEFNRLAARKSMVAAVARMYEPGCKWDHMLILFGPEGVGKSHWIERMSLGFSVPLGNLTSKDTLIALQRAWIAISDEGYSMRKADFDAQKEFITKRTDTFRPAYGRTALVKPRRYVIWGTTNDETFLRSQEGNRRFHIARCPNKVDFDALTDEYIAQVWAEAVALYRAGERLFLTDDESDMAANERVQYTEEEATAGIIEKYLDTLVPEDYWEMSPEARQLWLMNDGDGFQSPGTVPIDRVCSMQIWVEALQRRKGEHKRIELLEIGKILSGLPGWQAAPGKPTMCGYGGQKTYIRQDGMDLI